MRYEWSVSGKRPLNILQTIGNGCAFLDYDQDGNLDILLVGRKLALFQGNGKGQFTEATHSTQLQNFTGHFLGCAVGDYNNDGFPDVYISGYREGLLLQNQNGKSFRDIASAAGLKPQPWGTSAGWSDLDGDGWLDLYVCNYAEFGPAVQPQLCKFKTKEHGEVLSSCGPRYYSGIKGVAYRNNAGKKFDDVTGRWGMSTHSGRGLGVAFADPEGNGKVSVAIANDETPGDLFWNQGNEGTSLFENVGETSGTARDRDGNLHGGMGIDWGDFNNDGRIDLFVATFRNEPKSLYRNDGGGLFTDVSYPAGIGRPALPYVSFGCKFLDADNDGWLDLLIANGHVQDNIKLIENTDYPQNTLFLHNERGTFRDASAESSIGNLPPIVGRGLAVGDYDNDGRVDALIVDSEGKPLLLHNETGQGGKWIGFRCRTGEKGRDALGAVVTVEAGGKKIVRQCQPGGSYMSSSDARVHFGLGGEVATVRVTVRWQNGEQETWENIPVGKYYTIFPKSGPV
ncbi:MAG: hypothetical protein OHK0029_04880 [Armatimonadaceae bacterium]